MGHIDGSFLISFGAVKFDSRFTPKLNSFKKAALVPKLALGS